MRFGSILETIGNTPLVELKGLSPNPRVRIWAKLEGQNPTGSVKDRIALRMVEAAEADGSLVRDRVILEPTSGNTGIGLALVGRLKGYRVKVVMPSNVSPERRSLLELYGAEIVDSPGELGSNGAIRVAEELSRDSAYFMPFQYGNPNNPLAHYHGTGVEIVRDLPEVKAFVAGLGTGGTLVGTGRRLKEHNSAIKVIAVEPEQGDLVQGLRSLADGFLPPILDQSVLDSKLLVSSADSIRGTQALLREVGIFAGISSGAVLYGCQRVARNLDAGDIVGLLPDGGWKYLSTAVWTRAVDDVEEDIAGKIMW
ncbi:MAG: cysteine synthase family protein [Chloroflexota bacterium]|nr:MAG: cysteine synthase family protein [Chloroflexota bacterium]